MHAFSAGLAMRIKPTDRELDETALTFERRVSVANALKQERKDGLAGRGKNDTVGFDTSALAQTRDNSSQFSSDECWL